MNRTPYKRCDTVDKLYTFLYTRPYVTDLAAAERAICRAAARICGLTPRICQEAINGLQSGVNDDEAEALHRFAELAKEEQ